MVFPLLILISLLFASHLTFVMAPVYSGPWRSPRWPCGRSPATAEAVLFEGAALIALFVILATYTLFA